MKTVMGKYSHPAYRARAAGEKHFEKILKTSSHAIRYAENEILGVIRTPRFRVKLLVTFKLLKAMAVASTVCGGRRH